MQGLPSSSSSDQVSRKTMAVVTEFLPLPDVGVTAASLARRPRAGAALVEDAGHLLRALRTYAELMTTPGVLSDEYQHLARELQVLSDRSAAMLGRLVRLGPGTTSASGAVEATVLPDAVLDGLGLLSKMAGRAVTLFCSPSAYLPVGVPRSAVERILVNLVKNAAETSTTGGTVAVTLVGMREAGLDGGGMQVVLTVEGRGIGKSLAGMKELTASRVPCAKPQRAVGLHVIRELAESSGAKVEVESALDGRTSVSVRWPVMDPGKERRIGAGAERLAGNRLALAGLSGAVPAGMLAGGEAC